MTFIQFIAVGYKVFLGVWTIDQETIGFAISTNCNSLLAACLCDAITCLIAVSLESKVKGAKEMEEYSVVWLYTMNQFEWCGEFVVDFTRDVVGDGWHVEGPRTNMFTAFACQ